MKYFWIFAIGGFSLFVFGSTTSAAQAMENLTETEIKVFNVKSSVKSSSNYRYLIDKKNGLCFLQVHEPTILLPHENSLRNPPPRIGTALTGIDCNSLKDCQILKHLDKECPPE